MKETNPIANEDTLRGLQKYFDSKYVPPELLERIIKSLSSQRVNLPSYLELNEDTRLSFCMSCRRVYEITPQTDAFLLDNTQTHNPGPHCFPCAYQIIRDRIPRSR